MKPGSDSCQLALMAAGRDKEEIEEATGSPDDAKEISVDGGTKHSTEGFSLVEWMLLLLFLTGLTGSKTSSYALRSHACVCVFRACILCYLTQVQQMRNVSGLDRYFQFQRQQGVNLIQERRRLRSISLLELPVSLKQQALHPAHLQTHFKL